jgi:hypothetical protein
VARACSDWLMVAPNNISNGKAKNMDQTHNCSSFFTRTSPDFQIFDEQRIFTKINKFITNRTVFPQGFKICNSFALTLTMAAGSIKKSYEHQT